MLRLHGACQLTIRSLQASELDVDLRGAGRLTLAGSANRQGVIIDGLSTYEAGRLESQQASVQIRGSGRATVWATRELDVAIRGLGQVAYRGRPIVRQQVMPMGTVTPLDTVPAPVPHLWPIRTPAASSRSVPLAQRVSSTLAAAVSPLTKRPNGSIVVADWWRVPQIGGIRQDLCK